MRATILVHKMNQCQSRLYVAIFALIAAHSTELKDGLSDMMSDVKLISSFLVVLAAVLVHECTQNNKHASK